MLELALTIEHLGTDFKFNANIEQGKPHTFQVGEEQLGDKLFYALCGVEPLPPQKELLEVLRYKHEQPKISNKLMGIIDTLDQVDFSHTPSNNVLALGCQNMFLSPRTTVEKNIYQVLRARYSRQESKQKAQEILEHYSTKGLFAKQKLRNLTFEQLYKLSLARAYFREPKLVVINKLHFLKQLEIDYTQWKDCYLIIII